MEQLEINAPLRHGFNRAENRALSDRCLRDTRDVGRQRHNEAFAHRYSMVDAGSVCSHFLRCILCNIRPLGVALADASMGAHREGSRFEGALGRTNTYFVR